MAALHGAVGKIDGGPASIADIPGHGAWVFLVIVVGAHLTIDADGVQDAHGEAEEDANDGCPHAHNEGDKLGEEDEEGEHRDCDVEVGQSADRWSLSAHCHRGSFRRSCYVLF